MFPVNTAKAKRVFKFSLPMLLNSPLIWCYTTLCRDKSLELSQDAVSALSFLEEFTKYGHVPRRAVERYIPSYIFDEFRHHLQWTKIQCHTVIDIVVLKYIQEMNTSFYINTSKHISRGSHIHVTCRSVCDRCQVKIGTPENGHPGRPFSRKYRHPNAYIYGECGHPAVKIGITLWCPYLHAHICPYLLWIWASSNHIHP